MKNSLLSCLAPKETKFFPLLEKLSQTVMAAASLLEQSFQFETADERAESYRQIKLVEREGDQMTNLIFEELGKTFITPFDREDIHDLASSIDDVTDYINSSAKRIAIYNPHKMNDCGKTLAQLIRQDAVLINKAVGELKTFRKNPAELNKCCSSLHDIENHADDVYEQFITRLFVEEKDCIELLKVKEIMQDLEKTTDAAEHVGKILKSLIVKYA